MPQITHIAANRIQPRRDRPTLRAQRGTAPAEPRQRRITLSFVSAAEGSGDVTAAEGVAGERPAAQRLEDDVREDRAALSGGAEGERLAGVLARASAC